jgi:hypothetical protein
MGEGWSDWIALMMQIKPGDFGGDKRGIGTLFLHKLQMGIRDFQYSTDRELTHDLCFTTIIKLSMLKGCQRRQCMGRVSYYVVGLT